MSVLKLYISWFALPSESNFVTPPTKQFSLHLLSRSIELFFWFLASPHRYFFFFITYPAPRFFFFFYLNVDRRETPDARINTHIDNKKIYIYPTHLHIDIKLHTHILLLYIRWTATHTHIADEWCLKRNYGLFTKHDLTQSSPIRQNCHVDDLQFPEVK